MITKEQLQAMSDFEVNKALCTLLGKDVSGVDEQRNMMTGSVADYCDKYSAIMPLAFEHDIAYLKTYKTAYCKIDGQKHKQHYTDYSPLRAIACCLILVLQEKQK